MYKHKLLPVIAAMMITSMAVSMLSISAPAVVAAHTPTVTIDKSLVKGNTSMVLTITVANAAGSDAIDNVRIMLHADFTDYAPTKKVPKDNLALTQETTENLVVLKAGTIVKISLAAENVRLAENTDVIREKDTWVYDGTDNYTLAENATVEVRQATDTQDNLLIDDNVAPVLDKSLTLVKENKVRLIADTRVVLVSGTDVVKLPENTWVEVVVDDNASGLTTGDNVTLKVERRVSLVKEGKTDADLENRENKVRIVNDVYAYKGGGAQKVPLGAGRDLILIPSVLGATRGTDVVLRVGTQVMLLTATQVVIPENIDVIRPVDNRLKVLDVASMENQPKNWMQTTGFTDADTGLQAIEWKGLGDNKIAAGESLSFPFAVKTPSTTKEYTIYVRTKDKEGVTKVSEVKLEIDSTAPTAAISVSPVWAKGNVKVTITVKASEKLSKLDNVMIAENNATENTKVNMSSTDNITWTGEYTTGDNWERDGRAKISVIGAGYADVVGNTGTDNKDKELLTIDRSVPPKQNLGAVTNFPTSPTKKGTWGIEGRATDNGPYDKTTATENLENGTVKLRVGTTVYTLTASETGYFHKEITLTEGKQEVGIQCIDIAGNAGEENAENITYDATKPAFSDLIIAGKELVDNVRINDNTPTVTLKIADAVMGVENAAYDSADNSGYTVQLQYENGTAIATLNIKTPPTEGQPKEINFENTYPTALADGTYRIYVVAGDNLQMDNKVIKFVIDTAKPDAPTLTTSYPTTTKDAPKVLTTTTVSLDGTKEAGATIKIYTSTDGLIWTDMTRTADVTITYTSDTTYSASVKVTAGVKTQIAVAQVDVASNEGDKKLYGWVMTDATAPVISALTIDGVAYTARVSTDKSSIIIAGKVTDDVSRWDKITVTMSYAGTSTTLGRTQGATDKEIVFSKSVPLSEGPNTFTLSATDEANNISSAVTLEVERTVAPLTTYAIIIVVVALILAAIAIFVKK